MPPSTLDSPHISLKSYCNTFPELNTIVQKCSRPETRFIKPPMLEIPANSTPHIFHLETTTNFSIPRAGGVIIREIYKAIIRNLHKRYAILASLCKSYKGALSVHCWIRACDESWLRKVRSGSGLSGSRSPGGYGKQIIHISVMIDTPTPTHPDWLLRRILLKLPLTFWDAAAEVGIDTGSQWIYQARDGSVSRTRYRLEWFDLIASDAVARSKPVVFWSSLEARNEKSNPAQHGRCLLSVWDLCN